MPSGGEKRKIGMLRLEEQSSKIWLLDEPTSGLDVESKRRIVETLQKIKSERLIITSTHDIQLIEAADSIVFIKDGEVYFQGTLSDAMKNNEFRILVNQLNEVISND